MECDAMKFGRNIPTFRGECLTSTRELVQRNDALCSSEMLVAFVRSTRGYVQEDHDLTNACDHIRDLVQNVVTRVIQRFRNKIITDLSLIQALKAIERSSVKRNCIVYVREIKLCIPLWKLKSHHITVSVFSFSVPTLLSRS
jgi:hypothetical protein